MQGTNKITNTKAYISIAILIIIYACLVSVLSIFTSYPSTVALILLNIGVFVSVYSKKLTVSDLGVATWLVKGGGKPQYWRILSSEFTHAEIWHIFCNMYSLWNVGTFLEKQLGAYIFTGVYFSIGILGGLLSYVIHNKINPSVISIGASGIICGLVGIIAVMAFLSGDITLLKWVGQSILILVLISFAPRIDGIGHLSGLLVGVLIGFIIF
jgi:rhomboid protease GluP